MKKNIIKIIALILSLSVLSFPLEISAYGIVPEEKINSYLKDKGLPEYFVRLLNSDLKKQIFTNKLDIESIENTYGILTDKYSIYYTIEDGNIVIDKENQDMLQQLKNDETELAKLLMSKESINSETTFDISSEAYRNNDEIGADQNSKLEQFKESNHDLIQEVKNLSTENMLLTLNNWEAAMIVLHLSYKNSISKKLALYAWQWNSSPSFTLTDKAGMAWSGNYAAEPNTFAWVYQAMCVSPTGDIIAEKQYEGTNYTDYNPNAGIGTEIDIKAYVGTYGLSPQTNVHAGMIAVELTRYGSNSRESAVGTYFHKVVAPVNGSLSFSRSGPSVSISFSISYRKAPDSGFAFWVTS